MVAWKQFKTKHNTENRKRWANQIGPSTKGDTKRMEICVYFLLPFQEQFWCLITCHLIFSIAIVADIWTWCSGNSQYDHVRLYQFHSKRNTTQKTEKDEQIRSDQTPRVTPNEWKAVPTSYKATSMLIIFVLNRSLATFNTMHTLYVIRFMCRLYVIRSMHIVYVIRFICKLCHPVYVQNMWIGRYMQLQNKKISKQN
jgi:hypothetical protein